MKKYTFIMEFRGGTYISQVVSSDIETAAFEWARNLDVKDIQYMGESSKKELMILMKEESEPHLINGMDNVWCMSGLLRVGFFIVYAIC